MKNVAMLNFFALVMILSISLSNQSDLKYVYEKIQSINCTSNHLKLRLPKRPKMFHISDCSVKNAIFEYEYKVRISRNLTPKL